MGQLLGKSADKPKNEEKKKKKISEKDQAVLKLKRARDKLTKLQKRTEIDAEKLNNRAKDLLQQGRKDRALMALKIRKLKLKEVAAADSKLMNVVEMIDNIEWESENMEVLRALEAGTKALDKIHKEMPIEEVERILEESAESIELQKEIGDMISSTEFSDVDDSELEAQLEALEEEEEKLTSGEKKEPEKIDLMKLPEVPTTPILPDAPTHNIEVSKKTGNEFEKQEERNQLIA